MNDSEFFILMCGIYLGAMVSMLVYNLVNLREVTRRANAVVKAAEHCQGGDLFYATFRVYRLHAHVDQLGRAA